MQNKVIVSPDALILGAFVEGTADAKPGILSTHIDSNREAGQADIDFLIHHPGGNVEVVFLKPADESTLPVTLLLPSLVNYLTLQISHKSTNNEQIKSLIQKWQQYFQACRQLLLNYPDAFEAKGVSVAAINIKESIHYAILSDTTLSQLEEDWSTFIVEKDDIVRPITQSMADITERVKVANRLQVTVENLQKEHEQAKQQAAQVIAEKEKSIAQLTQQQQEAQSAKQQLNKNLADKTQQHDEATKLNESLQSKLTAAGAEKDVLQKEHDHAKQQVAQVIAEKDASIEQLTKQQQEAQSAKQQSNKNLADKTQQHENETKLNESLQSKLTAASAEKDVLQKEHDHAKQQAAQVIAEKETSIAQLTKQQQEAQSAKQQSNKNLADKTQQHENATKLNESLQSKLDTLSKDKNALQEQFKASQENNSDSTSENELLLLQINQIQEELENIYIKEQTLKTDLAKEKKQRQDKETQSEANQTANEEMKSENELLLLQIAQLQEELEHYFTAYSKISKSAESEKNTALLEFRKEVQARFPQMITAQKCAVTGGFDKAPIHRAVFKLERVTNFEQQWAGFSVVLNDRKGAIDIEFQAPDATRTYPLSTFVKSGNNKVSDYTLISPYTPAGINTYKQLPDNDQALLKSILNEIVLKLSNEQFTSAGPGKDIAINPWVEKVQRLIKDLQMPGDKSVQKLSKDAITPPAPSVVKTPSASLGQLTLLQNMVAQNNEHLSIRIKDLKIGDIHFPVYEFKIGAKKIHPETFTALGSIEFRELKGKKAPLLDWAPKQSDKWGPKLSLDITPTPTKAQLSEWSNLSVRDQAFIVTLLDLMTAKVHELDQNKNKLNQPIKHWQQLLSTMTQSLTNA